MRIFVDIDQTICITDKGDYKNSRPIVERISKVNHWYKEGHYIVYWTARGAVSGLDWSEITENQLRAWGAKYHELRFDKPSFDIFIDDKVINTKDWTDSFPL